jgi:hypothetical protein
MGNEAETATCPLCGLPFAAGDHVVSVGSRHADVGCVEPSHDSVGRQERRDLKVWGEWARGVGWGGSVA